MAFLLAGWIVLSGPNAWASRHYVQLRAESLELSLVERAVSLELRELSVPPNPERPDDTPEDVSLHVEIQERSGQIDIVVWERGVQAGRRLISAQGAPRLVARRIGLAVAEVVRDLRDARQRRAQELAAEHRLAERRALASAHRKQREALAVVAGVQTRWWTGGAWLAGPTLGIEFNDHYPFRFVTRAAWMTGRVVAFEQSERAPVWSQWEFAWGVRWVHQTSPRTRVSLGPEFGLSAVHLGSGGQVDGFDGQQDSYSATAGGVAALSFLPNPWTATRLSLGAARVLRRVPMSYAGQELRLGGTQLAATLSVNLSR